MSIYNIRNTCVFCDNTLVKCFYEHDKNICISSNVSQI